MGTEKLYLPGKHKCNNYCDRPWNLSWIKRESSMKGCWLSSEGGGEGQRNEISQSEVLMVPKDWWSMSVRGNKWDKKYWSGLDAYIWDLMVVGLLVSNSKGGNFITIEGGQLTEILELCGYWRLPRIVTEALEKDWRVTLGSVEGIMELTIWGHVLHSVWDVERGKELKAATCQECIFNFRLSGMKIGREKTAPS